MDIMENLDELTIRKCCFCIGLKLGCYIIAVLSIIILTPATSGAVNNCYDVTEVIRVIQGIGAFMFLLAILAGFFFVYGLFKEVRLPTMTYMVVLVIGMFFTLLTSFLVLTQDPKEKSCPSSFSLAAYAIVELAVLCYCFVVVNSYRVHDE